MQVKLKARAGRLHQNSKLRLPWYDGMGGRQSFAFAIIHALPLPPRHKDTKYTAFSATDCTDFHRFSSMLADVSVKIRGKNKKRQCPGRNIQPGLVVLCAFVSSWFSGSFERVAAQKYDAHPDGISLLTNRENHVKWD